MAMLRDAHIKHLISDKFKKHFQSVSSGDAIPRSPEGYQFKNLEKNMVLRIYFATTFQYTPFSVRLDCGGPMCLMRQPYEHVLTFSVLEVDRAFKHDKMNKGLKVRCSVNFCKFIIVEDSALTVSICFLSS